ncbi:tetratricopeptide repeat protein [Clostridium sp.]|uniref:tetratricopeptide repeat protein n=1 Tax=Clostridium sp. TaxID=1506 RepID=UPI003D6C7765
MVNYYKELNLDPSFNAEQLIEELKNTQRKWIGRTNAPDLNHRQEAERKVSIIAEAQKTLLDEKKRIEYDQQLKNIIPEQNNGPSVNLDQNNNNVDDLIKQSWKFINLGQYADGIMVARRATEIEGSNADAWATLAHADYRWNNVEEAIYEYKKAINLRPNGDSFYCDLGNIYLDKNMLNEAEEYANKAIHLNPKNNYNKILLGNVASNKNEYDKAISIFTELIKSEPDNKSYKDVIANSYYSKGISYCYRANDGYIYNVDENATESMIGYMKKAKEYGNDPEFDEKIAWGEKALKNTFDKSKWTLFIIPILMVLAGDTLIKIAGIAVIGGLGYLSMRPGWRLTRNSMFNEKTLFDKSAWLITATVGLFFTIIWGFTKGILDFNNKNN